MPTDYTLNDLARLAGTSQRTVRYYISSGLLPPPAGAGPAARYSELHLDRLRLIKRLQSGHLPLAEIRRRLEALPEDQIAAAADALEPSIADSALDYVSSLLHRSEPSFAIPVPAKSLAPPPVPEPPGSASTASSEPERAHWERISLDPDIEIHIRRPLSRLQNKRVERLISIARQLLEED
jgi:DNA-binding transcriptional MerR regulator